MKVAILGDIHGNREALEAVLREVEIWGAERILQVGDLVGYGPDPQWVIDRVRDLEAMVCLGNHDAAVVGLIREESFNPYARAAIRWTRSSLSKEALDYLGQLPIQMHFPEIDTQMVHGSLCQPESFDYVYSQVAAERSLDFQTAGVCFVGHTHLPCLYSQRTGEEAQFNPAFEEGRVCIRPPKERWLVNVGSVGQPRDQDTRAAWVRWETGENEIRLERVLYDFSQTQEKILSLGLPKILAERLSHGL